jgi:hypothetical protein
LPAVVAVVVTKVAAVVAVDILRIQIFRSPVEAQFQSPLEMAELRELMTVPKVETVMTVFSLLSPQKVGVVVEPRQIALLLHETEITVEVVVAALARMFQPQLVVPHHQQGKDLQVAVERD